MPFDYLFVRTGIGSYGRGGDILRYWSTGATNIQDAVDAAATAGDLIMVTNGIYRWGGRLVPGDPTTNRVQVFAKAITIQSVNGPQFTAIEGHHSSSRTNGVAADAIRCVWLGNGSALVGFTLTNGASTPSEAAGGIWCFGTTAIVSNCVITGNSSDNGGGVSSGTIINCIMSNNWGGDGGGADSSTLVGCMVTGNSAGFEGGGIFSGSATNCLIAGNSAVNEGGAAYHGYFYNCTIVSNTVTGTNTSYVHRGGGVSQAYFLANCIVYYNTIYQDHEVPSFNFSGSPMVYCCTAPLSSGAGNVTNAPLFLDFANADYHLQSNSPCINAGENAYVTNSADLDGNARIVGGTVDMGAYEFQTPSSVLSYAWAQQYGLPTDGSADFIDTDHDGMNNWQEWIAGTDPTNAASVLKMLPLTNGVSGVQVAWSSVSSRSYALFRGTHVAESFSLLQTNIAGVGNVTIYNDSTATNPSPFFYRVATQR